MLCVILNITASMLIHGTDVADCVPFALRLSASLCRAVPNLASHRLPGYGRMPQYGQPPEGILTFMSLLKSGLRWAFFGDQLANTGFDKVSCV